MTEKELLTDDDDFVIMRRGGEILSGGFKVDSILLKHKRSPMHTLNKSGGGNNVSDLFKDLAIPAGIFYQPSKTGGGYKEESEKTIEEEELDDDLYDRLVKLATSEDTQKGGRKRKSKKAGKDSKKNTKKNYKVK
jgi:hypothetical protein